MSSSTSPYKNALAVYGALVACILAIVLMLGNNYESKANRLDLKVMTLELKGDSSVIDRMGVLRNHTRAQAENLQVAALLLAIALVLFSTAIVIQNVTIWPLIGASFATSLSSFWLVWKFLLI